MGPSIRLARFVAETGYDDIPQSTIERAKLAVLDSLGIIYRGSLSNEAMVIRRLLSTIAASGKATVVAQEQHYHPLWASFANAVMLNSLELDDTCDRTYCHPAATIIPTALAMAEEVGAQGRDILTAIVLGYDIMLRIASAACSHRAQGFAITGTVGTFGAAVAAGKIIGLTEKQLVSALGLAGTLAPLSLLEFLSDGSMGKVFYVGAAAHNGILAALIASKGVTGPRGILEGPFGFLNVTSGVKNNPLLLSKSLGEKFSIDSVSIKPYACCRHFHMAIECLLALYEKNQDVDWYQDVIRIVVHSNRLAIKGHSNKKPPTVAAAQQSFPYSVAVALLEGHVNIDDYAQEKLNDSRRHKLASKVSLVVDEAMDSTLPKRRSCLVKVDLRNGKTLQCYGDVPKGAPEKPLTAMEVEDKFRRITAPVINDACRVKILNRVYSLEKVTTRELACLLDFPIERDRE